MKNIAIYILFVSILSVSANAISDKRIIVEDGVMSQSELEEFFLSLQKAILEDNKKAVANSVHFPNAFFVNGVNKSIQTKKEFLQYYDQIINSHIKTATYCMEKKIGSSNSRGAMVGMGDIWISSIRRKGQSNSRLYVRTINNEPWSDLLGRRGDEPCYSKKLKYYTSQRSDSVKNDVQALVASDKAKLHPSLHTYSKHILNWETKKYRIRIDSLDDITCRYSVWPREKSMREEPDLVLTNGERVPDGSGGNYYYEFKNGIYLYRCYVTVIGRSHSSPGSLIVYKNGKKIIDQDVLKVLDY